MGGMCFSGITETVPQLWPADQRRSSTNSEKTQFQWMVREPRYYPYRKMPQPNVAIESMRTGDEEAVVIAVCRMCENKISN